MSGFKDDFNERLDAAAKAKQAMLEKFRARQRPAESAADTPEAAAPEAAAPEPVADGGGKAPRKAGKTRK
jgi:Family of unknown function (DUF6481)